MDMIIVRDDKVAAYRRCCARLRWTASSLRADMIFGKDKIVRIKQPVPSVQNCSDCLLRLRQPVTEVIYERRPNMGRFIRRQNVERYWRLLDRVTNESDRQRMLELLVEERQKQRDAGDEFI
jgi:hypothetical protein